MEWKKFTDEMPPTDTDLIIRFVEVRNGDKKYWAFARIKRPADKEPLIYHPDYYQLYREETWLDLCNRYKKMYEWLDPTEDRNTTKT